MKKGTKKLICGIVILCTCVSVLSFVTGRYVEMGNIDEDSQDDAENIEEDLETVQQWVEPVILQVSFDTSVLDLNSNKNYIEVTIDIDCWSAGYEFCFTLAPEKWEFYDDSIIDTAFVKAHIQSMYFKVYGGKSYLINIVGGDTMIMPTGFLLEKYGKGASLTMRLFVELKENYEYYFLDEDVKLYWYCLDSNGGVLAEYLELETINLRHIGFNSIYNDFHWECPDDYITVTDGDYIQEHWDEIITPRNGWYMLPAKMEHRYNPWRDYQVELWFNPATKETVVKEV